MMLKTTRTDSNSSVIELNTSTVEGVDIGFIHNAGLLHSLLEVCRLGECLHTVDTFASKSRTTSFGSSAPRRRVLLQRVLGGERRMRASNPRSRGLYVGQAYS